MIPRYTRAEMGRVWSDANRYQKWLDVELAAADTLAEAGLVPKEAAATIRARASVDAARINELEARVKHDVIAFTMAVGESIGDPEAARWLHYGLTSNDVVDTAQALQIREASRIIERDLVLFGEVLDLRAARIPAHAADRPHARRARRAHYLRPENRQLVRGKPAQHCRVSAKPRCAWSAAKFPARWATLRISARRSKRRSASGWGWT